MTVQSLKFIALALVVGLVPAMGAAEANRGLVERVQILEEQLTKLRETFKIELDSVEMIGTKPDGTPKTFRLKEFYSDNIHCIQGSYDNTFTKIVPK